MVKFDAQTLIKDKRFWIASFLIAWAAALQGHMMWMQRQDTFKQIYLLHILGEFRVHKTCYRI
ncbi:uncharacterized protein LOC120187677 [Hibiscus syriacus]|uniref:uncharacterized protein LOC120187677 n=1 Tax=Hibiscus syriacus TaxID=106335 RepID=UPI001921566D|nr:uncharacterized protein LOC120187677 [Hibiscus syriacus]